MASRRHQLNARRPPPGNGTTFSIYLPRVDAPVGAAGETGDSRPPLVGTETILLVEDEERVRDAIRLVLESHGYAVLTAANRDEGIVAARRHREGIHLLITDVVMPGMSGRVFARQVASERPDTRVFFMSGYTDDAIVHHGVLGEGSVLLQKPFAP